MHFRMRKSSYAYINGKSKSKSSLSTLVERRRRPVLIPLLASKSANISHRPCGSLPLSPQPSGIIALKPVRNNTAWRHWQVWITCPRLVRISGPPRVEPQICTILIYRVSHEKLHHFIFAVTLSDQVLLWYFWHTYTAVNFLSQAYFSFFIKLKAENQLKFNKYIAPRRQYMCVCTAAHTR